MLFLNQTQAIKVRFLAIIMILLTGFSDISHAQETNVLVDHELIASYTSAELEEVLGGFLSADLPLEPSTIADILGVKEAVNVYRVTYLSDHPINGKITATGAIAVPQNASELGALPMAIYHHGTVFGVNGVPSNLSFEHNIGAVLASSGYVMAMPDYLGMGGGTGMHPYVHAKTQATAGIDLLRAMRELQEELTYELMNAVCIFGYSQGGHAAMAMFKELEEFHKDEFRVVAAAPMSGPYDISGSQTEVLWETYEFPAYLPYVVEGYRSVYPELLGGFDEIYAPEYAALNDFKGDSRAFFEIIDQFDFPNKPILIFNETLLDGFTNDTDHPLRQALRQNDVYDWTPEAPTLIMGCCDDEQVKFSNSQVCYDKFVENGAQDVELVDFCDLFGSMGFLGHGGCVPFCLLYGKQLFDEEVGKLMVGIDEVNPNLLPTPLRFYPNPATQWVNFEIPPTIAPLQLTITNIEGKKVKQYNGISSDFRINVEDLQSGIYFVSLEGPLVSQQAKLMVY